MEQEDKVLLGEFLLAIIGAFLGAIVTMTIEQPVIKYSLIIFSAIVLFIIYTGLVGRPWPRSYNRIISCEGSDEDINRFFMMYYYNFENELEDRIYHLYNAVVPNIAKFYMTVEKNKIKIQSENKEWLEVIKSLTMKIIESKRFENIKISDVNFQNALAVRPIINTQFRTSHTKIHFMTEINLHDIDDKGIFHTADAMKLQYSSENATSFFSWPDEYDFLYMKPNKKGLRNKLRYINNLFMNPEISYNFPFIRKHVITLDQYEQMLTYSVTIDAKWNVQSNNINIFYNEAIQEFNTFLSLWDAIDTKIAAKYRFKDITFLGLIMKDGIDTNNFAKRIIILKRSMEDVN